MSYIELKPIELRWMQFAFACTEMRLRQKIRAALAAYEGEPNVEKIQKDLIDKLESVLRTYSPLPHKYDAIINQLRDADYDNFAPQTAPNPDIGSPDDFLYSEAVRRRERARRAELTMSMDSGPRGWGREQDGRPGREEPPDIYDPTGFT